MENIENQQSSTSSSRPFILPEPIPESQTIMILGIASILVGCLGIIPAIMAINKAPQARRIYAANPSKFTSESLSQLKSGVACAWIGLILQLFSIIGLFIYIIVVIILEAF